MYLRMYSNCWDRRLRIHLIKNIERPKDITEVTVIVVK